MRDRYVVFDIEHHIDPVTLPEIITRNLTDKKIKIRREADGASEGDELVIARRVIL